MISLEFRGILALKQTSGTTPRMPNLQERAVHETEAHQHSPIPSHLIRFELHHSARASHSHWQDQPPAIPGRSFFPLLAPERIPGPNILLPVIIHLSRARIFIPLAVVVFLVDPVRGDSLRWAPAANSPIAVLVRSWTAGCGSYPKELLVVLRRAEAEVQARGLPIAAVAQVEG
jgi:hypothetical protein